MLLYFAGIGSSLAGREPASNGVFVAVLLAAARESRAHARHCRRLRIPRAPARHGLLPPRRRRPNKQPARRRDYW